MNKAIGILGVVAIISLAVFGSARQQRIIEDLRGETEFYRTHSPSAVAFKDIEKIYTIDLVSVSDRGVDATLQYRQRFLRPILREEGKYFRIEINVFGRND